MVPSKYSHGEKLSQDFINFGQLKELNSINEEAMVEILILLAEAKAQLDRMP